MEPVDETLPPARPPPVVSAPPSAEEELRGGRVAVAFFLVLYSLTLFGVSYVFWDFVTDGILGLLFAALSLPFYRRLRGRTFKGRDWVAASIICALIVILVAIPLTFLVTSIAQEASGAYDSARRSLTADNITSYLFGDNWVAQYLRRGSEGLGFEYTPQAVMGRVSAGAGAIAQAIAGQANALIGNVFSAAYHFIVMLLVVFYLLLDGRRLKAFVLRMSPLPREDHEIVAGTFRNVGKAILFGNGLGSILQGILGAIAMWMFGLPSVVLWGTVMAIFAFLPLVGISVVTIPATLYLILIEERVAGGIVFFAITTSVALFVENVIKTQLIGSHMKMHNLLIFLSILGGISAFGILGILYGPLIVALFLTLSELYERRYRARLPLPQRDTRHIDLTVQ